MWSELPLFPLNTVLFPGKVLPLHIFEDRYKTMIARCTEEEQPFGVVLIRELLFLEHILSTQTNQWEGGHSGYLARN